MCVYMLECLYVAIPTKTADGELCNLHKNINKGGAIESYSIVRVMPLN